MTNEEMLQEMRSKRGFHTFNAAKVQRMFGVAWAEAIVWIQWLVDNGHASRTEGSPWEVHLL